jgi:hypothetical protein
VPSEPFAGPVLQPCSLWRHKLRWPVARVFHMQEGKAQVPLSVERWDREGRLWAEVRVERGALTLSIEDIERELPHSEWACLGRVE